MIWQSSKIELEPRKAGIKIGRKHGIALVVGVLMGLGAGTAYADYATGSVGWYTVNGINYSNQADINTTNVPEYVGAYTSRGDGGLSPTGRMGADARSFRDEPGQPICQESGYTFNPSPNSTWSNTAGLGCGLDNYYSYGVTAAWNGNGYNYYYTFRSPNVVGS